VISRLKRLGNRVGPEDYERIVASVGAKVGGRPPSDAELEQLEREREQTLEALQPSRNLRPKRSRPVLTDEEIRRAPDGRPPQAGDAASGAAVSPRSVATRVCARRLIRRPGRRAAAPGAALAWAHRLAPEEAQALKHAHSSLYGL